MMPGLQLEDMAQACNAVLHGANASVTSVGIDSRSVCPGQLFVALPGARVDGHQFVGQARAAGAVGAVVEQLQEVDLPQLLVSDAAAALAAMARLNRSLFSGTVIAITGSAGKTTCKNMLAAILAEATTVHATRGNLNNELGVPLTLLELDHSHEYAIVEMGAAKAGDIAYLAELAQPQLSLVTNVSEAHLGGFGSLDVTAQTKGAIYAALPAGGVAVLNRDDPYYASWATTLRSETSDVTLCSFSMRDRSADFVASELRIEAEGMTFTVHGNGEFGGWSLPVRLPLLGKHNAANALASIALAKALQVDDASIANGLAGLAAIAGRLRPLAGQNKLLLLDDSYNANPAALHAAIDTLADLHNFNSADKRAAGAAPAKVLALGDMAELGANAVALHRDAGAYAASRAIDCLFATGTYAQAYVDGFNAAASATDSATKPAAELAAAQRAASFTSQQALAEHLLEPAYAGATVLVKGSRSAAMDKVVDLLAQDSANRSPRAC